MRRPVGGYTLIETILFIAISSIMLVISMIVFRGQNARVEFRTGVNDVQTKMQQWIDTVNNGVSNTEATALGSNYDCSVSPSGYPELAAKAAGTGKASGANPECIFLGKAIHFHDKADTEFNNHIFSYSVIGRRVHIEGSQQVPVDTLPNAKPMPVFTNDVVDLTEDYRIPNGVRVLSVTNESNQPRLLGGFYGNVVGGSTSSSSLLTVLYPPPMHENKAPRHDEIKSCINFTCLPPSSIPPGVNPWPMQEWRICLGSVRNNDRALIKVLSSNGVGVKIEVERGVGDGVCS